MIVAFALLCGAIGDVALEPDEVPDGQPFRVVVTGVPAKTRVTGRFERQDLKFRRERGDDGAPAFTALGAVPHGAKPGERQVSLSIARPDGTVETKAVPCKVVPATFTTSTVVTPPRRAGATTAASKTRRQPEPVAPPAFSDRASLARALSANTPRRLWAGRFLRPVFTVVTETFGARRVNIRGRTTWRSTHLALDLDGRGGEPVLATNAGRIAGAGYWSGSGHTVIIDHGDRLLSLYFHNERLHVKVGDRVERGTPIADLGATGRVTGPHLHFEVRLNGYRIDPAALIDLIP